MKNIFTPAIAAIASYAVLGFLLTLLPINFLTGADNSSLDIIFVLITLIPALFGPYIGLKILKKIQNENTFDRLSIIVFIILILLTGFSGNFSQNIIHIIFEFQSLFDGSNFINAVLPLLPILVSIASYFIGLRRFSNGEVIYNVSNNLPNISASHRIVYDVFLIIIFGISGFLEAASIFCGMVGNASLITTGCRLMSVFYVFGLPVTVIIILCLVIDIFHSWIPNSYKKFALIIGIILPIVIVMVLNIK